MGSDHLRPAPSAGPHAEMSVRALPFGGYVVHATPPLGLTTDFMAAFGSLDAALAFIRQHILQNPAQDTAAN